jgi:hypothetical protein
MSDAFAIALALFGVFACFAWFLLLPTIGLLHVLGAI